MASKIKCNTKREPTYHEFKTWLHKNLGYVTSIETGPLPYLSSDSCGIFDRFFKDFETNFKEQQKTKEIKEHCREIFDSKEDCDFDTAFDIIYDELNKSR